MDSIRSVFLWNASWDFCVTHWIHCRIFITRLQKNHFIKDLYSNYSGIIRILLWGFTWINNAAYFTWSICVKAFKRSKCLIDIYFSHIFFYILIKNYECFGSFSQSLALIIKLDYLKFKNFVKKTTLISQRKIYAEFYN